MTARAKSVSNPSPPSANAESPSPAEGRGEDSVPLPSAGEGQPKRSDGRERGRKKLLRDRAKGMRSTHTEAEHRLWQILRAKRFAGFKFKRQLPIDHYIVDFACLSWRLIIEADGGQHAENVQDERRDAYLRAQGFRVVRFWNNEIFTNEDGVTERIFELLNAPSPQPLSRRGERDFSGAPDGHG